MKEIVLITLMLFGASIAFADTLIPERIGTFEVTEEDVVYANVDGGELLAHTYRPNTDNTLYAAVEVHGGAWNYFDRMAGKLYNKALASAGIYIMAVDFRQGPNFKHPLGSRDVTAAVRYLKVNAARMKINPEKIGLIGSSSGGHLALLAGIRPNAPLHQGTPVAVSNGKFDPMSSIDAKVNYVIALWPVSDPLYRFEYAKKVGRDRLVAAHNGYFANPADMKDASIADIIKRGDAGHLPAILVVQPGQDKNIPIEMTYEMMTAYQNAGGYVDYAYYPNQPHAFAHKPTSDTDDCIDLMRQFIKRQVRHQEPEDTASLAKATK